MKPLCENGFGCILHKNYRVLTKQMENPVQTDLDCFFFPFLIVIVSSNQIIWLMNKKAKKKKKIEQKKINGQ